MHWIQTFDSLRLDIVGLIAVLGEGSVTRNAQVLSLSWWSILPRLLPAPQALIEHERKTRLETKPGTIVGAYSGTVKREINFFANLLHGSPPPDYEVELVEVKRREAMGRGKRRARSFEAKPFGVLTLLSFTGAVMSAALFGLAIYWRDGFGLLSVIMLSSVSSVVGFGAHWTLSFKEPPPPITRERGQAIPRSDLVIYYPNGAMRVIRAEETIARLYFQAEHCVYLVTDTPYRALALFATIMLMAGVIALANATNKLQTAFAAAYVILNALYWTTSALNPRHHHWVHCYETRTFHYKIPGLERQGTQLSSFSTRSTTHAWKMKLREHWAQWRELWKQALSESHVSAIDHGPPRKPNFTEALWVAIFLTGTSQWLNEATHIAPINSAWRKWLAEAERQAQMTGPEAAEGNAGLYEKYQIPNRKRRKIFTNMDQNQATSRDAGVDPSPIILVPSWKFQDELTRFLKAQKDQTPETQKTLKSELPSSRTKQADSGSQVSKHEAGDGAQTVQEV